MNLTSRQSEQIKDKIKNEVVRLQNMVIIMIMIIMIMVIMVIMVIISILIITAMEIIIDCVFYCYVDRD